MIRQTLKHLLGQNSFWMVNKKLAHVIGLEEAIVLQHLIDLEDSFFKHGGFYQQIERMANDIPLSERKISNIIKKLEEEELIKVERKGIPRRNYYHINQVNILALVTIENDDDTPNP